MTRARVGSMSNGRRRGRKCKGATPRKVVSLKLEQSHLDILDAHCKATGQSRGDVVTGWIKEL